MNLYAASLLLTATLASPELRYFPYDRPIHGTPVLSSQACIALHADTFARTAKHLADLRLYRENTEAPYAIRSAAPVQGAATPLRLLNLGLDRNQTTFDTVMPEGSYSDLDLGVVGQNFIATVTVFGSQSQARGVETKLGSFTIFDLTRQKLGRSTVLHLPTADFRYLHLTIKGPISPEDITSLTVERLPASQPQYQSVAKFSMVLQKDHSSVVVMTVPAHVPVDRVIFDPGSSPAMFSREVHIDIEPIVAQRLSDDTDAPPAPTAFSDTLLRIHSTEDGHRLDEEHLAVDTPSVGFDTATRWTVSIDNGDDTPLSLTSTRLEMLERDLCFDAVGKAQYALYYGDPALSAPVYDYAAIFTLQKGMSQAAAGPEQRNRASKSGRIRNLLRRNIQLCCGSRLSPSSRFWAASLYGLPSEQGRLSARDVHSHRSSGVNPSEAINMGGAESGVRHAAKSRLISVLDVSRITAIGSPGEVDG